MQTIMRARLVGLVVPLLAALACGSTGAAPADAGGDGSAAPEAGAVADATDTRDASDGGVPEASRCYDGGASAWDTTRSLVAPAAGYGVVSARVGFDAAGNAVAVWFAANQYATRVWASRRTPDGLWSAPVRIDAGGAPVPAQVLFADLAVGGDGSAVAVWETSELVDPTQPSRSQVWANTYSPGAGWASATTLQPAGTRPRGASVGIDAHGSAWAAFVADELDGGQGGASTVYVRRYAPGAGWAALVPVPASVAGYATVPDVAVDAAGDAFVAWASTPAGASGQVVQAARYGGAAGAWAPPVALDSCAACTPGDPPKVAADAKGDAFVVWSRITASETSVWSARYAPGSSTWSSPPDSLGAAGQAHVNAFASPQVWVDGRGDALALWHAVVDSAVAYTDYFTGGAWNGVVTLAEPGPVHHTDVAFDASGNGILVWDAADNSVHAAEFSGEAGTFAPESVIAAGASPAVAIASSGCTRALVVDLGADGESVYALAAH